MRISGLKSREVQLLLFDPPMGNHGHARTVVGNLAEELTAEYIGGWRHRTDSRADYCPDVSRSGEYYESKTAGRGRQMFIYGGRLAKDEEFSRYHPLWYVIWHHTARCKMVETVGKLEAMVMASMRAVYIVPFAVVSEVCAALPLERLNSKYGKNRSKNAERDYGTGYRIALRLLEPHRVETWGGGVTDDMRHNWRTSNAKSRKTTSPAGSTDPAAGTSTDSATRTCGEVNSAGDIPDS